MFVNTPNFFTGTVNYRPDTQRILAYNLITHARLADVSRDNPLLQVNETINITLLPATIAEINKFLWSLFNVPNLSFILITKTHKPTDRRTRGDESDLNKSTITVFVSARHQQPIECKPVINLGPLIYALPARCDATVALRPLLRTTPQLL